MSKGPAAVPFGGLRRRASSREANDTERLTATLGRRFVPRLALFRVLQLSGLLSVLCMLFIGAADYSWWLISLAAYFCTACLGMAICFHRVLAHRALALPKPLEYLFAVFGALGGTGSPIGWIAVHRKHHAHPDTEHDPHAPGRFGWRLLLSGFEESYDWWRVRDVFRDPFHAFLHRYYVLILGLWATALWLIDPRAMIFGFLIPAAAQITVTNLSTILGHGHGYRNFDTPDQSTNNIWLAALTWGEGWHNNHHATPRRWLLGRRWWEIDIAGLVIRLFVALKLIDRRSLAQD